MPPAYTALEIRPLAPDHTGGSASDVSLGPIYRQLFALGNASVLALAQALTCSGRNLRLNAELALGELAPPPATNSQVRVHAGFALLLG
jgi:hypothetical protein